MKARFFPLNSSLAKAKADSVITTIIIAVVATVKISVFANRIRRGVGSFEVFGVFVLFFVPMQSVQMSLQFHLRKLMLSEGLIQHNGH